MGSPHGTFGWVFATLDPAAAWLRRHVNGAPAAIPIDGKAVRGSHDRAAELGTLYLVSA